MRWWVAERGLTREEPSAREPLDRLQYFHGRRYLPDDSVQHLEWDAAAGALWARTATGVARITMRPMTLAAKAALFEERVTARHGRLGFVSSSNLDRPGDLSSNRLDPSDNDGLWTAMYAAAECYRYAVTREPAALDRARRATEAVLKLEEVTGRPGYPARSYTHKGDWRANGGTWHWTPDGEIEWKSDTSSDEIVGHFYLFALAYDLLPDEALRARIRGTAQRVMDHLLRHDLNLTDIHGLPTYWGRWSPEYFATPRGSGDGPLNAVELLSFLLVTHRLTGEAKYRAEYERLAGAGGYLKLANRLLELREELNYSDEELAMLPFYLVFRYEKNEALLKQYRAAMDQWWKNIQRERNPLWMFIYQTAWPKGKIDLAPAAYTLYRIPLDLINWSVDNNWRKGLKWAGAPDRHGRRESLDWIAPDERPIMKWNGNPFVVSAGGGGGSEDDGAFFLLPYWMGRYHKFLIGE
ncbi:MAG: hypothetical protein FJW31_05095 [Acidobacteria bacterium]|nr:hypothetical protein [Acidobacteriota bacterium]